MACAFQEAITGREYSKVGVGKNPIISDYFRLGDNEGSVGRRKKHEGIARDETTTRQLVHLAIASAKHLSGAAITAKDRALLASTSS